MVFAVLNKQHQFVGITDNIHRLNLIAKLLRENRWKTPKGFFNYSEAGAYFKKTSTKQNNTPFNKEEGRGLTHQSIQSTKNRENQNGYHLEIKRMQQELHDIKQNLLNEVSYLNDMKEHHQRNPSKTTQRVVDSTAVKIARLCEKQSYLEEKLNPSIAA